MTLIFSLGECVRLYAMTSLAQDYSEIAADNVFSEYNSYLWQNYKIMGIDLAYGSNTIGPEVLRARMQEYTQAVSNPSLGVNFTRMMISDVGVKEYALLTDDGGSGVIYQGSKYAKDNIPISLIEEVKDRKKQVDAVEGVDLNSTVSNGKNSISSAKARQKEKYKKGEIHSIKKPEDVDDNPIKAFGKFKDMIGKGVLKSVIPDSANLSQEIVDLQKLPSGRKLNSGNKTVAQNETIIDKALFTKYILDNFEYYGSDISHDGMKYEVEYVIAHKSTDEENLASVVERLLAMREASNFATIMKSPKLSSQAGEVAAVLSSFAPEIYAPVKMAIIAAWAYVESVLDVRLMLQGGQVPLLKNDAQWTSDVFHLSNFLDVNKTAKDVGKGLTYKQCLETFLMIESEKNLGLRSCDILENAVNQQEHYENVKLDNMLYSCQLTEDFSGEEMFLSLFRGTGLEGKQYKIQKQVSRCY